MKTNQECCLVCGDYNENCGTAVTNCTRHSDKQLYKFIETFVGEEFEDELISTETPEICSKCLEQLEEYDELCLRAAKIQENLGESFHLNQTRLNQEEQLLLTCKTCQTKFDFIEEMSEHECIDDSELFFEVIQSDDQDYVSDTLEEFIVETESSLPVKRAKPEILSYTCNICNKHFGKKREYQLHIKIAHLPEDAKIFPCSKCHSETFVSENELKLHFVVSHPADPSTSNFECPICAKIFSSKSLLNRHYGIHTANSYRPHICEICGKTFYHYSSFYAHAKIHPDIRDFKCTQCTKAFRSQSHLNRHMKSHTKTKNHECPKCGTRFAERYNLTVHLNSHFGVVRKKRKT